MDIATMPTPMSMSSAPTSMSKTTKYTSDKNSMVAPSVPPMAHYLTANQKIKGSAESIAQYFDQTNIRYEVIPGDHPMIRLLEPIYFKSNSMTMTDKSRDFLENVARYLANYQGVEMVVEGHTDSIGAPAYNEALSMKRAEAVKSWISSRFKHLDSIYTRGYGSAMPACENVSSSGKACNRRVEVFFILPS
jgi:outer membrane protein OmpA-like peptidoglycan-associated protein